MTRVAWAEFSVGANGVADHDLRRAKMWDYDALRREIDSLLRAMPKN